MFRFIILILGLGLLAAISMAAVNMRAEHIQYELQDQADLILNSNDLDWAKVSVDGRDITLEGEAPDQSEMDKALVALEGVVGMRTMANLVTLTAPPTEVVPEANAELEPKPEPVPEPAPETTEIDTPQTVSALTVTTDMVPPSTEPEELAAVESSADAESAPAPIIIDNDKEPLPVVTEVTNERCQDNINFLLNDTAILFDTGSEEISAASAILLDELALILATCPKTQVEISGHTDATGIVENNITLSRLRAEAVEDYLIKAGIEEDRLSAVGYGPLHPVADNKTEEGRKLNRRIELQIKS